MATRNATKPKKQQQPWNIENKQNFESVSLDPVVLPPSIPPAPPVPTYAHEKPRSVLPRLTVSTDPRSSFSRLSNDSDLSSAPTSSFDVASPPQQGLRPPPAMHSQRSTITLTNPDIPVRRDGEASSSSTDGISPLLSRAPPALFSSPSSSTSKISSPETNLRRKSTIIPVPAVLPLGQIPSPTPTSAGGSLPPEYKLVPIPMSRFSTALAAQISLSEQTARSPTAPATEIAKLNLGTLSGLGILSRSLSGRRLTPRQVPVQVPAQVPAQVETHELPERKPNPEFLGVPGVNTEIGKGLTTADVHSIRTSIVEPTSVVTTTFSPLSPSTLAGVVSPSTESLKREKSNEVGLGLGIFGSLRGRGEKDKEKDKQGKWESGRQKRTVWDVVDGWWDLGLLERMGTVKSVRGKKQ